ncbi:MULTISPECIES: MarR family winged helix-turn-helix transcriptional regulator [Rhizobium/Agrobacterium group]|uniref:Winged helix-turn-helix transcriptional regulator n=2 Tax=Agrobacterium tumefaciens complex TaxID=1183400 RepID=A0AAE6BLV8_AGRTU|nr:MULTISPECIES: MarR family winged helix-turn-helix transcriptional regulator [Rhizobium/Agrobacterium group]KNY35193.1 MarR family transcriptional regulator [Agrobacterium sp. SUL3]KRA60709.1 MarR family transcriptional regulator [Rhizobium sp. Root651]MCA2377784.1 winged helix-turn-helix transcriptional regulator [Agrobacterium tomkonis RTP8]MCD4663214.1 MarR family winged helix-turn-helix transcriptional regulator [Agrobacterium sp.]QCL89588.1 winged helix-turn-helix transcriptional regula
MALRLAHSNGPRAEKAESDGVQPVHLTAIDYGLLTTAIGYHLRHSQLAVANGFSDVLAERGLRPADFSVLVIVGGNPGLKQSDVAEALGIQRANFVAIVDSMEEKGLLVRRRSEEDRRVHFLDMTEEGSRLLDSLSDSWRDREEKLIDRIGGKKARDQLLSLLGRLRG